MSSFKNFLDKAKENENSDLPQSNTSLLKVETALVSTVSHIVNPCFSNCNSQQEFSRKVASVFRDDEFISTFSDRVGEPSTTESEDEFVARGLSLLKKMLYEKFRLNS